MAEPREIPEAFGILLLNGSIDSGTPDLARPARHAPCRLPFPVWMALANAAPASIDRESTQREQGDTSAESAPVADAPLHRESDA